MEQLYTCQCYKDIQRATLYPICNTVCNVSVQLFTHLGSLDAFPSSLITYTVAFFSFYSIVYKFISRLEA